MERTQALKLKVGDKITWHGGNKPTSIVEIKHWHPEVANNRRNHDFQTHENDYPIFMVPVVSVLSGKSLAWNKPVSYYWITPIGDV